MARLIKTCSFMSIYKLRIYRYNVKGILVKEYAPCPISSKKELLSGSGKKAVIYFRDN
jgi:hypothetical protein